MIKRLLDIVISFFGLLITSPLLILILTLVWLQDFHSPFYVALRVGRKGRTFRIAKIRSMVVNADKSGVDSTAADDRRITSLGHLIRRFKIDEISQLWNVLKGDMSLVGPRPNVQLDVDLYTDAEKRLLEVKPGITDFSSIVFSDEGEILKGRPDPDLSYNQLIRPWKSRLGLFYIDHMSLVLDLRLIALTAIAVFSRKRALAGVARILEGLKADKAVRQVAYRCQELRPFPPPGALEVVTSR